MSTSIRNLRGIRFRECSEPPHEGEHLPPGMEERYDLDLWFEFEEECLFFRHNDLTFHRVEAPPADAMPIPTTPDEGETDCLPESFLSASLLSITPEETPGFILRFDNGGIMELAEDYVLSAEGPGNPYLSPNFYSSRWLAEEENGATRAYLEEELASSRARNLLETLPRELLPAASGAPGQAEAEAEPEQTERVRQAEARRRVSDVVNDVTPHEHEALKRALWSGEYVRWATRPWMHRWNNTTLIHFALGVLWTAWCAFVVSKMVEQQPEAATGAANSAFFLSTLPFWCVGGWLLLSPWRQPGRLRKTLYIITNKRAMVLESGFFSQHIRSWELARNMVADREELSGDRGCLLFCDRVSVHADSDSLRHGGFLYLGNLSRAEKELRRALEAKRQKKT